MKVKTVPFLMCVAAVLGILQGCASLQRLPAVPQHSTTRVDILGIPNARFFVDDDLSPYLKEAMASLDREKAFLTKSGRDGEMPPANFLALSGGGDDGAFGAGLLVGWTQSGTRPQFKLVTGISTGALIAPFAFLGPDYDHLLKEFYTGIRPEDIYLRRNILSAITSDALSDNKPLWNLVKKLVNRDMLNEIAAEYEKGRILLIGTTNLDSRRPVIWNMGAIASSKDPRALDLFDSILLASAAIPGVFPPVMIPVEINGKPFEEMHVDGGATAQVFVYPPSLFDLARSQQIKTDIRKRNLYVIRNGRLDPEWATVDRRLLTIAGRSISSLIHSQGVGDLFRIYLVAKKDGVDYNLAYIGPEFNIVHKEDFDNVYMKALFEYSYDLARNGYPWKKTPPFLESSKPSPLDLSD
jgi:hypothetical protein